jgi:hypothetical protein
MPRSQSSRPRLQNGSEIASCGAKLGEYFGLKAELSKKASAKGSDSEEFWALERSAGSRG